MVVKCLLVEKKSCKYIVKGEIFLLDLELGEFDPTDADNEKNLISHCETVEVEPRYAVVQA